MSGITTRARCRSLRQAHPQMRRVADAYRLGEYGLANLVVHRFGASGICVFGTDGGIVDSEHVSQDALLNCIQRRMVLFLNTLFQKIAERPEMYSETHRTDYTKAIVQSMRYFGQRTRIKLLLPQLAELTAGTADGGVFYD